MINKETHYLLDTPIGAIGVWESELGSPAFIEWYDSLMSEAEGMQFRNQWQRIIKEADFLDSTKEYAQKYIDAGDGHDEQEERAEYCVDQFKKYYTREYGKGEMAFIEAIYEKYPSDVYIYGLNGITGTPEETAIMMRNQEDFEKLPEEEQQRRHDEAIEKIFVMGQTLGKRGR